MNNIKKYYYLLLVNFSILLLISCKNGTREIDTSIDEQSESIATHIIDVKDGGGYILLRNELLSRKDLILAQKGDRLADEINKRTVIETLSNGQLIRIIKSDTAGYHYIETVDSISNKSYRKGFIAAKWEKKNTLKRINKIEIPTITLSEKSQSSYKWINDYYLPKGGLLKHAYAYITQEADFIQVLSLDPLSENEIFYKISVTENQSRNLLINGRAGIQNYYVNEEGVRYAKYFAEDFMGHRMEIHLSADGSQSHLILDNVFNSNVELAPRGGNEVVVLDEKVIMQRIK